MKKILIQEGNSSIRDVLQLSLEEDGYEAILIEECNEYILNLIYRVCLTVVVLDFKLHRTDCLSMCHKIKSSYPELPILAISCNNNIGSIYKSFGFDGYIKKPFDLDVLSTILRQFAE